MIILRHWRNKSLFLISSYIERVIFRSLSSMDSGLEAFSHNPTDDSFSSLSVRINE